ncbi:hypothetical protein TWF751_000451 [Orbilia oligospora]|nr:hypothetical protein TWF751_000451 [Orbilia oligospora]
MTAITVPAQQDLGINTSPTEYLFYFDEMVLIAAALRPWFLGNFLPPEKNAGGRELEKLLALLHLVGFLVREYRMPRSMPNSAWPLLCTKRKEFSSSSAGSGSKKEAPAKMCRGVGAYCSLVITECRSQRPPTKSASIDRNFRTMSKSKA